MLSILESRLGVYSKDDALVVVTRLRVNCLAIGKRFLACLDDWAACMHMLACMTTI